MSVAITPPSASNDLSDPIVSVATKVVAYTPGNVDRPKNVPIGKGCAVAKRTVVAPLVALGASDTTIS